ncbi:MAG: thioredoxin family protein [Elusimicrobiota bacterium]
MKRINQLSVCTVKQMCTLFLTIIILLGYTGLLPAVEQKPGIKKVKPAAVKISTSTVKQEEPKYFVRKSTNTDYSLTMLELGSTNCIPCKMMEKVLYTLDAKYGRQVNFVFIDVRSAEGTPYAHKYNILGIPTQVFLDKDGNEVFRHVGYFPADEVVKTFKRYGVK